MSFLSYVAVAASPGGGLLARAPSRKALKRVVVVLLLLAGLGVAGKLGYRYWTEGRFLQSTTNAYVRSDYTIIVPKISGYVIEVLVTDNESVTEGQVLARIDDRDLRASLDQARADVNAAKAALRNLDAQIAEQRWAIDQERATITSDEAAHAFAEADNKRYHKLKKTGYGSVQRAQQAEATMREMAGQLQKSRAGLLMAERHIEVLDSERAQADAQRERAEAAYHQAKLNLSYTSVAAPVPGMIGARALRVGQYVQAGTPLMAVVPLHAVYIVANYKETQLAQMRAGQPAAIEVDTFPGVLLKGHVDSVSPASGLEFSLLPADNATGNFVKIVQRVPVKIALDDNALQGRLRSGMSVEATIDTKERP
jgi:membrane fusion protein (multidrug efflux system)